MRIPSRVDYRLAIGLVSIDMGFVLLNLANTFTPWFHDPRMSIGMDGGYAEWFQYLKEAWIAFALGLLARRRRSALLLAVAGLYAYFLLDDSLRIHESAGALIASWLAPRSQFALGQHLRVSAVHVGEFAISAAVGIVFLAGIVVGYRRSDTGTRAVAHWLFAGTLLLAGLGVGLDAVDVRDSWLLQGALRYFEEGGEMVVMSGIVTFVSGLLPDIPAVGGDVHPGRSRADHGFDG